MAASSAASSISAARRRASRWSSRSSCSRPMLGSTAATEMPRMTITTSNSIRVKPRQLAARHTASFAAPDIIPAAVTDRSLVQRPVPPIRIDALAPGAPVGAKGVNVDLAVLTRVQILIDVVPGVLRQPVQIAARPPVLDVRIVGALDQRGEALLGGGVAEVVQAIEFQRRFDAADILLDLGYLGVVDAADDVRCDDGREQADDDHHDHDLDRCEARLSGRARGAAHVRRLASQVMLHDISAPEKTRKSHVYSVLPLSFNQRNCSKHGVTNRQFR